MPFEVEVKRIVSGVGLEQIVRPLDNFKDEDWQGYQAEVIPAIFAHFLNKISPIIDKAAKKGVGAQLPGDVVKDIRKHIKALINNAYRMDGEFGKTIGDAIKYGVPDVLENLRTAYCSDFQFIFNYNPPKKFKSIPIDIKVPCSKFTDAELAQKEPASAATKKGLFSFPMFGRAKQGLVVKENMRPHSGRGRLTVG